MTMTQAYVELTPGTCLNCRRQKQRCDRVIPSCSRCIAKAVRCEYLTQDQTSLRQLASVSQFATETLVILRGLCPLDLSPAGERALLWAACSSNRVYADNRSSFQSSLSHVINEVFDSAGVYVVDTVSSYFDISHHWLPILNRTKVLARTESFVTLKDHSAVGDDTFALMIACMYLFVAPPCQHQNHPVRNTLYRAIKDVFAILQSSADTSGYLELLQCGIILATCETGHGMTKDAYETLIACRGLIQRIYLGHRMKFGVGTNGKDSDSDDLALDLCWGAIILLDKTIVLSSIQYDLPQVVPSHDVPQTSLLYQVSSDDIYGEDAVRNLLARAQHALRVGDMLKQIEFSTETDEFRTIEKTIYDQIGSYISKTQGGRFPLCETVAMSLSTLMVLYRKTDYLRDVAINAGSNLAVTSAYNLIIDTCRVESDLLQRHGWHNNRRPCFLGLCCLLAASVNLDQLCSNGLADGDMKQLEDTLTGFSSRWKLGDTLLEHLLKSEETI